MPKLSNIQNKKAPFAADFKDGDVVTGHYRPYAYDAKMEAAIAEMGDDPPKEQLVKLRQMSAALIIDWDLTDDADKAIPLTVEGLQGVPSSVLVKIVRACADDQTVGE